MCTNRYSRKIVENLSESDTFKQIEAVKPGFINIKLSEVFLANYLNKMTKDEKLGCSIEEKAQNIIVDYGGANIAKPLHVGHLRSAIIGESIKRICTYVGHKTLGDVHLGDWGLQMGLVIIGLKEKQPDLVYFDSNYQGEYPENPPFTISELEEIYPEANANQRLMKILKNQLVKLHLSYKVVTEGIWLFGIIY